MARTVQELQSWYQANLAASSTPTTYVVRDVTKSVKRTARAIDKEELKRYMKSIGSNPAKLRDTAVYLYYRSNIMYRIVNFYADMWDLRCRKVTPEYSLVKDMNTDNAKKKVRKAYEKTLQVLDNMNLQGNMTEVLLNVYIKDVYFGIKYLDDTGMFLYPLEPNECLINRKYATGDYGFCMDMSKWDNAQRQAIIGFLGSPLKEMFEEYKRTKLQWVSMPDEYAVCFKFRTDTWDLTVPPLLPLFLQLAGNEDLIDIQADADELAIYKLLYIPMKVHSSAKEVNDFEIAPELTKRYFDKLQRDGVIPDQVSAAMIPGDELKTIDFEKSVDSDTNSVVKSANQILQTGGGGAVINSEKITTNAAFKAWLKSETNFAMSTLLPQINGFANRTLKQRLGKQACKVDHFKVSEFTKEDFAKQVFESCQYGFNNKIAYATLLGFSERETLAQIYLEEDVLGLHELMQYPLVSSHTQSGSAGAPTKDDDELTPEGDRSRNA